MAKKVIVISGTITAIKKGKGKDAEAERVTLKPGDPVGTLISKEEQKDLIEAGTLGYAEDLSTEQIDLGDIAAELAGERQRAEDATKAAEKAKLAQGEAENLAAKAGTDLKAAEDSLGEANGEIDRLKAELLAANKKIAALEKK